MGKGGRKPELTQKVIDDFAKIFRGGATIKDACAHLGIGESTYFSWMKRGDKESGKEEKSLYVEFMESNNRARAYMRIRAAAQLQTLGKKDPKALMFLLERSDPDNWGKRTTIKIEGNIPLDLINTLIRLMQQQGLDPEQALKDMLAELSNG